MTTSVDEDDDDDDGNNDDDLSLRSRRGVYIDRRMSTPATGRATRSHHRSGSPLLMISSCVPHTQTRVPTGRYSDTFARK